MSGAAIVIGTSSWADPGFVAEWYPQGLADRDRLPYYAERFDGVEVNSTYYAVPGAATVRRWAQVTPKAFTFDVKLHQSLSRHSAELSSLPKGLRDGAETTPRGRVRPNAELDRALCKAYKRAMRPLADAGRLSSYLLQLSPAFKPPSKSLEELDVIVEALAPVPVAVEFRHRAWLHEERRDATLGWLRDRGAVFVGVDAPQGKPPTMMPPVDAVTNPRLAYLRLHGRNARGWVRGRTVAERFGYRYDAQELEELAQRAEALAEEADSVRVMFNNNRGDDAPVGAQQMKDLLA